MQDKKLEQLPLYQQLLQNFLVKEVRSTGLGRPAHAGTSRWSAPCWSPAVHRLRAV